MKYNQDQWEWFGNAGHFICGDDCRFHMCTLVGPWLVSTIGQLWSPRQVREIRAKIHDPEWHLKNRLLKGDYYDAAYMERFGYEDVGCDRKFETMVFRAGKRCDSPECSCGLPEISGSELDFTGYNNAGDATRGHMEMCRKWADRDTEEEAKP